MRLKLYVKWEINLNLLSGLLCSVEDWLVGNGTSVGDTVRAIESTKRFEKSKI